MNAHDLLTCTKRGGMGEQCAFIAPFKKSLPPNYPPQGEGPHTPTVKYFSQAVYL